MKLRQQIYSIVAIPLIGISAVSGLGIYQSLGELKATQHVETALDYADVVSALVHELQAERGYSAGFVNSGGENFVDALPEQRERVDVQIEAFAVIHDDIKVDYPELLSTLDHDLETLGEMRAEVSSLNVTVPDLAKHYTHIIHDALAITENTFAHIHLGSIALAGASYVSLSEAKEAAGIERAMGAVGFGSGEFTFDTYSRFIAMGAKQSLAMFQAELYSDEALPELDFAQFPEVEAISEMRKIVSKSVRGGDLAGIGGPEWFATSTAWIERLRSVEFELLEGIHGLNKQETALANSHIYAFTFAAAISLLLSIGVVYSFTRRFSGHVSKLNDSMGRVARKEFNAEIETLSVKSEIGDLSKALDTMRGDLQEADAKLVEAFTKSFAFEDSNSAMMIVGPDMVVTSSNTANKDLLSEHQAAFSDLWPGFDAETMEGCSVDRFHKNPDHQRAILSDPSRLPWRTDISIGDLKFEVNASYVQAEDGTYAGNILQWRDVTEERLHAGVIKAIDRDQCMVEYTLDGELIRANDQFLELVQLDAAKAAGRRHESFLSPDEPTRQDQTAIWKALKSGKAQYSMLELTAPEGGSLWLRANLTPIVDGSGKAFKVVLMASDVTDTEKARLQAEAAQAKDQAGRQVVVQELAQSLNRLSEGDLTCQIKTIFDGEYERLRIDFNEAVERLSGLIKSVDETVTGVAANASEVSAASTDLARRTETQAATLEETAAALEELTANVKSTADNAREADAAVEEARSGAEVGGSRMREVVEAMSKIEESTTEVGEIMVVIEDISFQTNLLALNAGVEAARAGEAGRGFSVVASEVRALAQRASDSARDISALINKSSTQVNTGVELVTRAGEALETIVSNVGSTSKLVGTITHAAQEQATALQEINSAVNSMDQTTQHNAAMVEETTAVSTSLSADAENLQKMTASFTTSADDASQDGDTAQHKAVS